MESKKPPRRVSSKPKLIDFQLTPRGWVDESSTSVQANSPVDFKETTFKFDSPSQSRTTNFTPRYRSPVSPDWRQPDAVALAQRLAELSQQIGSPHEEAPVAASVVSTEDSGPEVPSLRWCAFCAREAVTFTRYKPTSQTFWSSVGICVLGGVCGCFLLPWMTTKCQEPRQVCLRCKRLV